MNGNRKSKTIDVFFVGNYMRVNKRVIKMRCIQVLIKYVVIWIIVLYILFINLMVLKRGNS